MFLRLVLITLVLFQFQLKAQTPNYLGKSILDAFLKNKKSLWSNLKDSNALALKADFIETVKELTYDDSAKSKLLSDINKSDLKSFQKRYKEIIDGFWINILKEKYSCGLVATNKLLVKKEVSNNLLQSESEGETYLLLFNESQFAIRFYIVLIKEKSYLKKLGDRIYYPDDKGNFTCTSTCKNGKNTGQACIKIAED